MFFGLRRLSGIMDWLRGGSPSSVSISREERPRCSVRALATARRDGGVMYGRGKGWIVLNIGRVIAE